MSDGGDPRVFFAAERTLLAWIRTGLAVMGLGFVVARFGLFLRLAAHGPEATPPATSSTALGVAFVLLGAASIAMGTVQFVRFSRTLPASERPQNYDAGWAASLASLLAVLGVVLAVYLVIRAAGA
jgi:putative membrane protein